MGQPALYARGCCRESDQGATAWYQLSRAKPFAQGVLTVWVKKPVDGIYRRMAEHKVYVCLKTSVKSISWLRGKRRKKTKNRERLSSRILDLLDPHFLQGLHRYICSPPARQRWRNGRSIYHTEQDSIC